MAQCAISCRFWYQYSNINALVEELGIDDPFTDWTRSSFWTPDGLQVLPQMSHIVMWLSSAAVLLCIPAWTQYVACLQAEG